MVFTYTLYNAAPIAKRRDTYLKVTVPEGFFTISCRFTKQKQHILTQDLSSSILIGSLGGTTKCSVSCFLFPPR